MLSKYLGFKQVFNIIMQTVERKFFRFMEYLQIQKSHVDLKYCLKISSEKLNKSKVKWSSEYWQLLGWVFSSRQN